MTLLALFLALTFLGLLGYAFQVYSVKAVVRSNRPQKKDPQVLPPVSILKPLKGLDDNLFDNLESFCGLQYPQYEVIFCLQDYNDPAYKVAKKVKDRHPERDITVVVSHTQEGLNPKVNNLLGAYRVAKYPLVLISDSNVSVGPDYLQETVSQLIDSNAGLLSNIIVGVGGKTLGAVLENLHLNSFIVGSVCFLDRYLKMPCVIGKSMLMWRADLEALGGLEAFKDVLAEDYVIGRRFYESGRPVVLSNYAIKNVNYYWDLRRFLNRHTRWGKLRWKLGGMRYLSELIANPVFLSLLPIIVIGITTVTLSMAIFTATIKAIGDMYLSRVLKSPMHPLLYILSPIKDILIGVLWFLPLLSNTVQWRGNRYIIGRDTMLSPYPETTEWSWRYRFINAVRMRFA
jgi:ceramide glucosyltransferase